MSQLTKSDGLLFDVGIRGEAGYAKGIVGVCSADDRNIECWSPSGKPNSNLTERIESYFIDANSARIKLQFQRFNRLIITQERQAQYRPNISNNFSADLFAGDKAVSQNDIYLNDGNDNLRGTWISLPKAQKSLTVSAVERKQLNPLTVPLKVGAHAEVDGYAVDVMHIDPSPTIDPISGQPLWTIKINTSAKWEGINTNAVTWLTLDEDGDAMNSVDKKGKPFTSMMSVFDGSGFNFGNIKRIDKDTLVSRADVTKVASLSIYLSEETKVNLGELSLFSKGRVKHI